MKDEKRALGIASLRPTPQRIAILVGLGVLSVLLLLTISGGREALNAFRGVNWLPISLAIVIHYSGFVVRGHRWQQILRGMGHRVRYLAALALLLSGWFASALLPARAGDALRVLALRTGVTGKRLTSESVPVADGVGSIVLERMLDMLAILLLGAGFGWFVLRGTLPQWVLATYVAAIVILLLFVAALVLAPPFMGWLRGLWGHKWWQVALDFVARFVESLRTLAKQPALMLLVVGESLYIWLCDALLLWLVLLGLQQSLDFGWAAFVALTVDIVAAVPITPGGIGQIEVANTGLLALAGIPAATAAAAVLLVRAISYWTFMIFTGIVTATAGVGALATADADLTAATAQMKMQARDAEQRP